MDNKRRDAGCFVMPSKKLSKEAQTIADMIGTLVLMVTAFVLMGILSGCGTSAGWRFSIGVSPVTAINDQQTLTEHAEQKK